MDATGIPPLGEQPHYNNPIQKPVRRRFTRRRVRLAVGSAALVIVLAVGGVVGYGYYEGRVATDKFNALALQIKNQEMAVARRNAQATVLVSGISAAIAAGDSASGATLNARAGSMSDLANQSCSAAKNTVTPAAIDQQMKGLRLDATQQRYVSDIKQVLLVSKDSSYNDATLCRDGMLMAAIARNFAFLNPGLRTLTGLSDTPTASQMDSLKTYATSTALVDQASLQASTPKTAAFFSDAQQLLSDTYKMFAAINTGDLAGAGQYITKVTSLGTQIDSDTAAMNTEVSNLGKRESVAAIKASQLEIAAIDYQRSHKVADASMQLDYSLPAFRIADATIGNYTDAHSGSYPYGSSAADLVSTSPTDMKALQSRGLLKTMSYQSLGSDQSGFSLSVTLSDGSSLSEKFDPHTVQSA